MTVMLAGAVFRALSEGRGDLHHGDGRQPVDSVEVARLCSQSDIAQPNYEQAAT